MSRLADLVRGGTPGTPQEGEGRTVARVARVASSTVPKTPETGRTVARVARVASSTVPKAPDSACSPPNNNNNNNVISLDIYRGLLPFATATLATSATQEGGTGEAWPIPEPTPPPPSPRPTPSPSCEAWEERAAILEHDGGLSRAEAEEQATCRRWLIHLPDGWRDSTFTPPASMADLRRWHPAALALVPCDDEADPWGEDDPECGAIDTPSEYIFGGSEDPGAAFYADLFRGMDAPRAYVTLGQAEIHAAVVAGLIRPEDTRGAVILAYRDPSGSCALLAIPQGQWDPFAVLALMDGPGTLH